jgi:hypothetical protein
MPAFAAEYPCEPVMSGAASNAATLATKTIAPPSPTRRMIRNPSRAVRNAVVRFKRMVASQAARLTSASSPSPNGRPLPPAMTPRASRRSSGAKAASVCASSVRSATAHVPPISSARLRASSSTFETTWTAAPPAVSRRAVAAAMPVAPVTAHCRPARALVEPSLMDERGSR